MIKYGDLVQYIRDNHVNWNTDLFDVLRGFFESQSLKYSPPQPPSPHPHNTAQHALWQENRREFHHPDSGEYTTQDVLDLFST